MTDSCRIVYSGPLAGSYRIECTSYRMVCRNIARFLQKVSTGPLADCDRIVSKGLLTDSSRTACTGPLEDFYRIVCTGSLEDSSRIVHTEPLEDS